MLFLEISYKFIECTFELWVSAVRDLTGMYILGVLTKSLTRQAPDSLLKGCNQIIVFMSLLFRVHVITELQI